MTATNEAIEAASRQIWEAWDAGVACPPVRTGLPDGDLAAAYAVQERNTELWLAAGRRLVGRKIGLTSRAIQAQLGVDQPDYGMLYADMVFSDGQPIPAHRVLQPRIEAELAFVLGDDLDGPAPMLTDVLAAIDYALPALEVVGSRIAGWNIGIVDTIADNASSGVFVLGTRPVELSAFDPRLCGVVVERRGDPVSIGAGAACMGNPLTAVVWLARKMVEVGRPLEAGDIVLSGGLGPMVDAHPGDVFEARISGVGSVRAVFAEEG